MADEKTKEPKEEKKAAAAPDEAGAKKEKGLSPDAKKEAKKEKDKKQGQQRAVKKVDYGPDFKYIVRIANTDLDGTKMVEYALTGIKGVGIRMGTTIADLSGISRSEKIGKLNEQQIETLAKTVEELATKVPSWAVNRQFDWESGNDMHLVSSNVEIVLRDDLNRLKKIRSYRGLRHEAGLPVRGQRTRSHGRTGLTVGVQRKKEEPAKAGEEGAAPAAPKGGGGAKPLAGAKPAAAPAAAPAEGGKPAAGGAKPAAGGKPAAPAGGAKPTAKPEGGKK